MERTCSLYLLVCEMCIVQILRLRRMEAAENTWGAALEQTTRHGQKKSEVL